MNDKACIGGCIFWTITSPYTGCFIVQIPDGSLPKVPEITQPNKAS